MSKERGGLKVSRVEKDEEISNFFSIGKCIGRGSFGVVYEAIQRESGIKCCIKKISRSGQLGQSTRHKWGSEISIIASVRHPGIVHLHGILETPMHYLIITEICEGGSLSSHLNALTETDLGFKECIVQEIVLQLTSALVYLHNRSIIHRDIKPDNVLLVKNVTLERLTRLSIKQDNDVLASTPAKMSDTYKKFPPERRLRRLRQMFLNSRAPKMYSKGCDTTGLCSECEQSTARYNVSDLKIKLVDFGLAVELQRTEDPLVGFCGTPLYMAPEVLSGRSYTRQCDVWSLGVITYQLLCKDFPFVMRMERKPLHEVDRWKPKLICRGIADHVGISASHWLSCVLQPDPVQRFSAAELLRHDWLMSATEAGYDLSIRSSTYFRSCSISRCVSDSAEHSYGLQKIPSNIFSFMQGYKTVHNRVQ